MNYFQKVLNSTLQTDPQPETRFLNKTVEELANEGWYLCVNYGSIDIETQYYDPSPIINDESKTVTYTVLEKTPEMIEQYHQEIIAQKVARLWNAAYSYEFAQISGSAVGMLTALVLNGNVKGIAVQTWIRSIWNTYYERKAAQEVDWQSQQNESFYDCGNIPHSIPELIAEYDALLNK